MAAAASSKSFGHQEHCPAISAPAVENLRRVQCMREEFRARSDREMMGTR
jgi:hypothetical protein